MSFRKLLALVGATLLLVGVAQPCSAEHLRRGVVGGTIRGTINNAHGRTVQCEVAVPDSFIVLDVKFWFDRLLIAACVEREGPHYYDNGFLSEFWMFTAPDSNSTTVTYRDRKVLLSRVSTFGESMTTYAYSISCNAATAVYDAGWEWGTARVFDKTGRALPDIRDVVAQACGCNPEYTHPVAWLEVSQRPALVLSVTDSGLGPYYVRYFPDTGDAEGIGPEEINAEFLWQVESAVKRQRQ
ncbi:MAG: hypothetical protein IPK64_18085 [bacterium]|nr:hypothetical protein [bacterium]